MIILTSPTKQMNFSPLHQRPDLRGDLPVFSSETAMLNTLLEKLDPAGLAKLMKISPAIADTAAENIHLFGTGRAVSGPAILSYSGTVYQALDASSLSGESIDYAGRHLRILSGLYGLLKPMDLISPYRLEMKTPLMIQGEGRLNTFWKARIAAVLAADPELSKPDSVVINLASGEYSRAVDKAVLDRRMITFYFKEKTVTGTKTVGMYAKKARGLMLRRILTGQTLDPESLKEGGTGGYSFDPALSSRDEWVFTRDA